MILTDQEEFKISNLLHDLCGDFTTFNTEWHQYLIDSRRSMEVILLTKESLDNVVEHTKYLKELPVIASELRTISAATIRAEEKLIPIATNRNFFPTKSVVILMAFALTCILIMGVLLVTERTINSDTQVELNASGFNVRSKGKELNKGDTSEESKEDEEESKKKSEEGSKEK